MGVIKTQRHATLDKKVREPLPYIILIVVMQLVYGE